MDEKAPDELIVRQPHGLVALSRLCPIVLPLERDALVIVGDEPAVRDCDPMGVAGEVGEDRLFNGA